MNAAETVTKVTFAKNSPVAAGETMYPEAEVMRMLAAEMKTMRAALDVVVSYLKANRVKRAGSYAARVLATTEAAIEATEAASPMAPMTLAALHDMAIDVE